MALYTHTHTSNLLKEKRGITLIALVVTIIVLLILAAVSISAVVGENGIITKASNAKADTVVGREKDSLSLAYSTCQTENLLEGNVTAQNLKAELEKLNESVEVTQSGYNLIVKYLETGNAYKISQTGEIIEATEDEVKLAEVKIYAKLYTYDDGSGSLLELSSDANYTSEESGVSLAEDYGNIGNVNYNSDYDEMPPWCADDTIIKAKIVDKIAPVSTSCWFYGLENLCSIENISNLDTSNVIDMNRMFCNCESLSSIDVSGFDTSKVTDISWMFCNCESLTELDVSGFDTSNVIDMSGTFKMLKNIDTIDLSNFDTTNVKDMMDMFSASGFTSLDLSDFDTTNVEDMQYMFQGCTNLADLKLSGFKTSNVKTIAYMFRDCHALTNIDLSEFDISNVEYMGGLFYNCMNLTNINLKGLDTSNVKGMVYLFWGCSSLNSLDLSSFDTSNVLDMDFMFYGCTNLSNIYVGDSWIVSQANTNGMFNNCGVSSVTLKTE